MGAAGISAAIGLISRDAPPLGGSVAPSTGRQIAGFGATRVSRGERGN
jgi:hypothetical protein